MSVPFTVTGRLADFGDDPLVGVKVRATATPAIKKGEISVYSNQPEPAITDSNGEFTLELLSIPGLWYRISAANPSTAMNMVRFAAYIPDSLDPTTGTEFAPGTTIAIVDIMEENPTPGYEGLYLTGGGGGVTDHGALTGLADDDHPQYLTQARGDARYFTEAETTALIVAEETARANADAALLTTIGNEVTARTNADTAFDTRIDALEAAPPVDLTPYATDADLAAHAADTTGIHGIADTAALVVTTDPRLSDARTPTAHIHDIDDLNATGTPDGTTYLRGDATWATIPGGGVTDHGALTGLGDDDHTQYALADGSRGSFATTAQGAKADTAVQPADLTPLATDADLTAGLAGKEPLKGSDDNYVTDAEKAALHTHPAFIGQGTTAALARDAIGAGINWQDGEGPPLDLPGEAGGYYLDTLTGDVYEFTASGVATFSAFDGASPPTAGQADTSPLTVGVEFYSELDCEVTKIRWWQPTTTSNSGTREGKLYDAVAETVVGTATSAAPLAPGWNDLTFPTPVPITANTRYRAAVFHPAGNYVASTLFFDGIGNTVDGPLVVVDDDGATLNKQGSFSGDTSIDFPDSVFNSANYWVDVEIAVETDWVLIYTPLPPEITDIPGLEDALGDKQPVMGSDDNYVTDAEKAALHTHPAFVGQGTTAALARAAIGAGTGDGNVVGTGITAIVSLSQAAYDALSPPSSTTLYVIV